MRCEDLSQPEQHPKVQVLEWIEDEDGAPLRFHEVYEGDYFSQGWRTSLSEDEAFDALIESGILDGIGSYEVESGVAGGWYVDTEIGSFYHSPQLEGFIDAGVLAPLGFDAELIKKWQIASAAEGVLDGD